MKSIDMNCDMGESFGNYRIGNDAEVLRWISSANIACGFHAGDASAMRRTVSLCLERGVRIGAHPGLPDLQGFGRRRLALSAEEVFEITLYQIGALCAFLRAEGGRLEHVKPHGALYHMAEEDDAVASSIAKAVALSAPDAALVGLSEGALTAAGAALGLRVKHEAFADRAYLRSGRLAPRSQPGAVHTDPKRAAEQALSLAMEGTVDSIDGERIAVRADTICIHGDSPQAPLFAEAIHRALAQANIAVGAGSP